MKIYDWAFCALVVAVGLLIAALAWTSWKRVCAEWRADNADENLRAAQERVSMICNYAALNVGQFHPEVDIVCKAIETAFLEGGRMDAAKLERDLDRHHLTARNSGGAS